MSNDTIETTRDKQKIEQLLKNLPVVADRPVNKYGNLDIKKFNKLKEVKWVISELKKQDVDNQWLYSQGFMIASVILRF